MCTKMYIQCVQLLDVQTIGCLHRGGIPSGPILSGASSREELHRILLSEEHPDYDYYNPDVPDDLLSGASILAQDTLKQTKPYMVRFV